jgi:hypothetical protein
MYAKYVGSSSLAKSFLLRGIRICEPKTRCVIHAVFVVKNHGNVSMEIVHVLSETPGNIFMHQ